MLSGAENFVPALRLVVFVLARLAIRNSLIQARELIQMRWNMAPEAFIPGVEGLNVFAFPRRFMCRRGNREAVTPLI
jgi:hypothetical protein